MLLHFGTEARSTRVKAIFTAAQTSIRQPRSSKKLVDDIDKLDWFSAKEGGLGDLYEGLLERNAGEKKSGAGQYFTPRPQHHRAAGGAQPGLTNPPFGTEKAGGGSTRDDFTYQTSNKQLLFLQHCTARSRRPTQ